MMNEDYKTYGKILGALNKDCPPKISKKFADDVMSKLQEKNAVINTESSYHYLNIAASVVFAVITSFVLVNYYSQEDKLVSNEISQPKPIGETLIKKVIDKDPCNEKNKTTTEKNYECK
tara:strand:- start:748 stop:1104 length:357 start_codon:yes stop_codon:yes gene_type:complete